MHDCFDDAGLPGFGKSAGRAGDLQKATSNSGRFNDPFGECTCETGECEEHGPIRASQVALKKAVKDFEKKVAALEKLAKEKR